MPSVKCIKMEAIISTAGRHGNSVGISREASIDAAVRYRDILDSGVSKKTFISYRYKVYGRGKGHVGKG